ncbi:MAG: Mov34/MPN/PAD-1 family protein [Candidatus Micrarchaeota archaeon]
MVKIKREAIELALHASKNTYPDEFIALLRDDNEGTITHILVLPRSTYGKGFSSVDFHMLPMFSHSCGSFHSHPVPDARPSRGDRLFFGRLGKVHIIAGYPYREQDARAYDRDGKSIALEVAD